MPKDYDKIHYDNIDFYSRKIAEVYNQAIKEGANISMLISNFNRDKPFYFNDYPVTKSKINKLIELLISKIETIVLNGIDHEWALSNNKNDELSNSVFGGLIATLTKQHQQRYYNNNDNARDTFKKRKALGLGLSDRVWKFASQFKAEIERGIDLGLRDGLSASEMARELKQYLRHPDKLFRRVRDEHGELVLSKSAKLFNPGQGVYRSSVRNAQRLARTEINMAYRGADHERWQQMDFVVGIKVRRSSNHSFRCPMCDSLAGKYPKDFKFTGWHPQCRCFAIPILKTNEEFWASTEQSKISNSVNQVTSVPLGFNTWITDNSKRIKGKADKLYFIKDNPRYV